MPYKLQSRNVLVVAGSRGLGALVAEKFAQEGCNVVINYMTSEAHAKEVLAKIRASVGENDGTSARTLGLVQGDAGVQSECARIVREAISILGGLDVIISNAGWTKITKFDDLDAMDEDEWDRCWAVNVKGHMYLFKEALATFNANPEGGVFIITSSVAGVALHGSSMPYSVTKAAGLHLMKCLAQTQGSKVRVNAILPGLLMTDWGARFSDEKIKYVTEKATLKQEGLELRARKCKVDEMSVAQTKLEDCAATYVAVAKNTSLTGQEIQVDSGLFIGMS
ncbi:MAG: hypothetical protein M1838_003550 [Thelocarpon superellum]|nr:MAG: hypothetical protein M1838_003550 [Thelocarpon superellum]